MTIKKALIFSLVFLFLHCRQRHKPVINEIKNGSSYECVLLDPNASDLKCGILKVAVAMKFQIKNRNSNLIILIQCPEMYGQSFFLKGQKYTIKLTDENDYCKDCTVFNGYNKLDLPTYFAAEIKKSD